jgi:hypothetical protein
MLTYDPDRGDYAEESKDILEKITIGQAEEDILKNKP